MKSERADDPQRILLIGRRRGAIAAARRCGWEPVTIDVAARNEQAPSAFGGSIRGALGRASELFPTRPPLAVVAVATGAVTAAAALRSRFGLPGISPETAARCHDKLVMKKAIGAAGIPCASWREVTPQTTPDELIAALGLPLVLKLPISSGGRGVWVCRTPSEIADNLAPQMLAESFTDGIEMSVETFRVAGRSAFRNHTRYLKPRWANVVPADLEKPDEAAVDALAERVHDALGISTGVTHMEVFLTRRGPVFGEIAARPPGGYLMELIRRAYGFDPWESLLRLAAGEQPRFPQRAKRHAGVWLLHPDAGEFLAVEGLDAAAAMPGVAEATCKLAAGERVGPRIGSGESSGKVLVEAVTHTECCALLSKAVRGIRFTIAPQSGHPDRLALC